MLGSQENRENLGAEGRPGLLPDVYYTRVFLRSRIWTSIALRITVTFNGKADQRLNSWSRGEILTETFRSKNVHRTVNHDEHDTSTKRT